MGATATENPRDRFAEEQQANYYKSAPLSPTAVNAVNIGDHQQNPVKVKTVDAPSVPPDPIEPVQPAATNYYADTMSKAGTELPQVSNAANVVESKPRTTRVRVTVEAQYDQVSNEIDEQLRRQDVDFEKLQMMVHNIVMLMMRRAVKTDHDYIREMTVQIKAQAVQIQGTYNTWPGLTITLISAGIGIGGGIAGLTPLFPSAWIAAETANTLNHASQAISSAGTGLGGVGSIFNSRSEGQRQVLQITLRHTQDKEEDRKGAKQGNNETRKSARAAQEEFFRSRHEATKAMCGA